MKLTQKRLKQIIKEELNSLLNEEDEYPFVWFVMDQFGEIQSNGEETLEEAIETANDTDGEFMGIIYAPDRKVVRGDDPADVLEAYNDIYGEDDEFETIDPADHSAQMMGGDSMGGVGGYREL